MLIAISELHSCCECEEKRTLFAVSIIVTVSDFILDPDGNICNGFQGRRVFNRVQFVIRSLVGLERSFKCSFVRLAKRNGSDQRKGAKGINIT